MGHHSYGCVHTVPFSTSRAKYVTSPDTGPRPNHTAAVAIHRLNILSQQCLGGKLVCTFESGREIAFTVCSDRPDGPGRRAQSEPQPSGRREPLGLLQALGSRLPIDCTIGHEPAYRPTNARLSPTPSALPGPSLYALSSDPGLVLLSDQQSAPTRVRERARSLLLRPVERSAHPRQIVDRVHVGVELSVAETAQLVCRQRQGTRCPGASAATE